MTSVGPLRMRVGVGEHVGQHRRRLAEAHVEGEAAAEAAAVEEVEPGQRVGLVAAQLADEALGRGHRLAGDLLGLVQQVGGPAAAGDREAAGQRHALEPERVAQHLGAGELGRALPLGQRFGRGGQVGVVDRDPLAVRLHQWTGLRGQPGDLGRVELDVVEQHRPPDVGQLVGTDHRRRRRVGFESQRRRGPLGGQPGDPHVEAGRRQPAAEAGHELPGLVLAEDDLAAAVTTGAQQRREHPLEPGQLGLGQASLVGGRGDQRAVEGHGVAVDAGGRHDQLPRVALVGRVELDHELRRRRPASPAWPSGRGGGSARPRPAWRRGSGCRRTGTGTPRTCRRPRSAPAAARAPRAVRRRRGRWRRRTR